MGIKLTSGNSSSNLIIAKSLLDKIPFLSGLVKPGIDFNCCKKNNKLDCFV